MDDLKGLHEECGVFGVYGYTNAASLCYYGLHSLQHRGQEAAGILVSDRQQLSIHKGEGLVTEVFNPEKLDKLSGDMAIGHVRYSTTGGGGIANVQPFSFEPWMAILVSVTMGILSMRTCLKPNWKPREVSSHQVQTQKSWGI